MPCLYRFFFNATATTEIYPLSLHDALPIWASASQIGATNAASSASSVDGSGSGVQGARHDAAARSHARREDIAGDRKSTRLNSSHLGISYAVFCLKKKKKTNQGQTAK